MSGVFASSLLKRAPPLPLSRRRALAGFICMCILAVMVIGNLAALSVFLWQQAALKPIVMVVLLALWAISAIALFYVSRGARFFLRHWPDSGSVNAA